MSLSLYFEFIKSCEKKEVTDKYHKHHIIPKYMGGSNDISNIIKLSYENHQTAHLILSECFKKHSVNYNRNIWAVLRLQHWVDNGINISNKLSEIRLGKTYVELFGEETARIAKNKISIHFKKYWSKTENRIKRSEWMIENNPFRNKYHTDKSKEKQSKSRKKWWNNLSPNDLILLKEKRSLISKKWWSSLTEEQLIDYSKNVGVGVKKWWDNADDAIIKKRNKKISYSQLGKPKKEESIKKMIETFKKNSIFVGENNPMYGKHHTESTKMKISAKLLGNKNLGGRLDKTFSIFKFFKENEFIYEANGQKNAKTFCKNMNISFQNLCKCGNNWNNWYCERKIKNNSKIKNDD